MLYRETVGKEPETALVVDDNEINRIVAAEVLRGCGVETVLAQSGLQALEFAGAERYSVIFMDYHMPEMNGGETAKRIRELGGWNAQVPIVGLSAEEEGAVLPGMDDYLSKPLDPARLELVLRRWLPGRQSGAAKAVHTELEGVLAEVQAAVPELDIRKSLHQLGGSQRAYIDLLRVYLGSIGKHIEALGAYAAVGDWENLRIAAHAQKGALYNIGANALAERAQRLESLLASEDYAQSQQALPPLLSALAQLSAGIKAALPAVPAQRSGKLPATAWQLAHLAEMTETVTLLLNRLEREQALAQMQALAQTVYGEEIDALLAAAYMGIENFDYDGASVSLHRVGDIAREV